MNWSDRDSSVNWHPFSKLEKDEKSIAIVRAEGSYLWDEDGNRYIDAVSSWWVNIHGHCHPHLMQAIKKQTEKIDHVIFAGFTHPSAVQLSEKLLDFVPGNFKKVFYSDDGSTAIEVAIKMALQYHQLKNSPRKKIIAFENSYHGDTFGAMSVSGRGSFTDAFAHNLLSDIIYIPVPKKEYSTSELEQLKTIFKGDVAAFIFEPLIQGAGGMVIYNKNGLRQLIELAQSKNIITIADEIFTGFGRTGKFFAMEHVNVATDIKCLSKGITGGVFPLGVTLINNKIEDTFQFTNSGKTFYHGHSYTANALICASAVANLELFDDRLLQNIKRITDSHLAFMVKAKDSLLLNVRSLGTILAFEYASSNSDYDSEIRDKIYLYFIKKGLLMRPLGNTCYLVPPYCISNEDLNYIYDETLLLAKELSVH